MREQPDRMRHAAQSDFDRNGDGLFNFFGGTPREKCDDLNLRVGDIGERFYRKRPERCDASSDKQRHKQNQKEWLMQPKGNKTLNHGVLLSSSCLLSSRTPLVTTRSSRLRPSSTTVYR